MNQQACLNSSLPSVSIVPKALSPSALTTPVLNGVQAGFPAPSGDYMEEAIDLNEHLIQHPSATFLMRVNGESMIGAHIPPSAILVVDRSLKAVSGCLVVAVVNGEFTCKRYEYNGMETRLLPESPNPKFKPIVLSEGMEVQLWGVVRHIIIDAKTV